MIRVALGRLRVLITGSSFLRFLISGGTNTATTYAVYLALLYVAGYKFAYTIAYVFGIVLAFMLNRFFVFRSYRGWRSVVLFPVIYLAQYMINLGVIWLWVERLKLPQELAPLIAIAITIPMTFVLSRLIFGRA